MRNDKDRYWDCLDQAMEASHRGRMDEALAWLDEALRAYPAGAEAHNGRGEILWDEGRIDEAAHEFERAILVDPKFTAAHLNRIELMIEELAAYESALERCDELLSGRAELPRPETSVQAEVYYLKSKALFYVDDLEGAIFLVRRANKAVGMQPVYSAFEGQILFELGRYEEAQRVLEHTVSLDPDSAHVIYYLGLVLERLDAEHATEAFARANALDPHHYPLPLEISTQDFEKAVATAIDNLPRSIRDYIADVPVLVEDLPSRELIATENVSPQILGLFVGSPRTEASTTSQALDLDRVMIFVKNHTKVCRDHEELIEQLQITVRHEIGHYLGLDEEDMERLGLA
ncbi:MAG: metallopeptidase family protein [Proteobacteria bacterium]|jgi:predicted Zn-dependent protease with MMP-like domain|nr:metallopeptidase family protein [Pseudomonadota bacterium]MDE0910041.1 metallopeptidase family protein [Myxococcota bacterium]